MATPAIWKKGEPFAGHWIGEGLPYPCPGKQFNYFFGENK